MCLVVVIIVLWLIEQEVGCELLVLVACEISLDGKVTLKAEAAELHQC